jgi:hypothetical protein
MPTIAEVTRDLASKNGAGMRQSTVLAPQRALETAGVEFIPKHGAG